jgi:inosose dehydratase
MPTVPPDVFVPFLARTGYTGIEPTVIPGYTTHLAEMDAAARRRFLKLVTDHGLEMPAVAAQTDMVAREPDLAAANWKRLTDAVDLATEWAVGGAPPAVDTTVGGASGEWDALKGLLFERMGALVRYGEERGVVIAAEPHVANMLDSVERVLELLDAVGSPFLKLNFDISHFNVQGVPYEVSCAALGPHTVHTHVKSERGTAPDHEFLIPGEAPFEWVGYLHAMRDAGYDGFITPEVSIMVQRRPGYDPLAAAELAYRTLAHAFDEAGFERRQTETAP